MKIFHSVPFNGEHFNNPDMTIGGSNPRLKYDSFNQYFFYHNALVQEYAYVHIKSPKTTAFKSFKSLERKKIQDLESYRFGNILKQFDYGLNINIFSDMEKDSNWLFILIREKMTLGF